MNQGNSDPTGWIFAIIIGFVLLIAGGFIFPGLNTVATSANTTGWLPLTAGVHSLIPYAFFGAILLGMFLAWAKKGNA